MQSWKSKEFKSNLDILHESTKNSNFTVPLRLCLLKLNIQTHFLNYLNNRMKLDGINSDET